MGESLKQRLGIVILNYNSYVDSEKCISEFLLQVKPQDCILVIDNHSNDGSGKQLAERFEGEAAVEYIQNRENLGYARGNNIGIDYFRKEQFDLTLICNPDIILLPGALEVLRTVIKKESASAVGPKILDPEGNVAIDCAKNRLGIKEKFFVATPLRLFDFFGIRKNFYYDYDYSQQKEVHMLSGSFMLFDTEVLTSVEGFDSATFLYEEEPIIFHKIHLSEESKVLFVPDARVIHNHGKGLKSRSTLKFFIDSEQYYLKHYLRANKLTRLFFLTIRTIRGWKKG